MEVIAYDCAYCNLQFGTAQSLNCHLETHNEVSINVSTCYLKCMLSMTNYLACFFSYNNGMLCFAFTRLQFYKSVMHSIFYATFVKLCNSWNWCVSGDKTKIYFYEKTIKKLYKKNANTAFSDEFCPIPLHKCFINHTVINKHSKIFKNIKLSVAKIYFL